MLAISVALWQQIRDLRAEIERVAAAEPDFCPQRPLSGRIHFSRGQVLGEVKGLPPNSLIDAKWVAYGRGGTAAFEANGRTDRVGRLRFDGPSFGASLVGTMVTFQVAPSGGFEPPAYVC